MCGWFQVRTEPRRGVKIVAGGEDLARSASPDVDGDDRINGVDAAMRRIGMVLSNTDPQAAPRVNQTVGIAELRVAAGWSGREWRRFL
jgi:hypothetical protein